MSDLEDLVERLIRSHVEFVLIGGFAILAHRDQVRIRSMQSSEHRCSDRSESSHQPHARSHDNFTTQSNQRTTRSLIWNLRLTQPKNS